MAILRVMTYALGNMPPEAEGIIQLIRAQRPDLVFLQHLHVNFLESLGKETGLTVFMATGAAGFLSRYPLHALQSVGLGGDGYCLRADLDVDGKRVHLFNIQLDFGPGLRGRQIMRLFQDDLLGARRPCATLIAGDFSLPLWGSGQWTLSRQLKKVHHPIWGANFPAVMPLWARDRFYLRGPIRALAGQVIRLRELRQVSNHLPLVTTLELTDTFAYLKQPEIEKQRMRAAVGEA